MDKNLEQFMAIADSGSYSAAADALHVSQPALSYNLKKLEAKGLVKVEPDAHSGRQKRVTITAKGRAIRKKAIAAAAPLMAQFGEAFSIAAIDKQTRQLQKVRKYLDDYRYQ